ncbi:hypothetical protein KCU65_g235, partial [Aureobasidium melanogenum]
MDMKFDGALVELSRHWTSRSGLEVATGERRCTKVFRPSLPEVVEQNWIRTCSDLFVRWPDELSTLLYPLSEGVSKLVGLEALLLVVQSFFQSLSWIANISSHGVGSLRDSYFSMRAPKLSYATVMPDRVACDAFNQLRIQSIVPSTIPDSTVLGVLKRCSIVWGSMAENFGCQRKTVNACLAPELIAIEKQVASMARVANSLVSVFGLGDRMSMPICLRSLQSIEEQCQNTITNIQDILAPLPEWAHVPKTVHVQLNVLTDELEKHALDLTIIWRVLKMSGRLLNLKDHGGPSQPCNWDSAFNAISNDTMTPATEDWTDVGSIVNGTTESSGDTPPIFSRREVEGVRDLADAFAQSLDMLLDESHVEKVADAVLSAKFSASVYEQSTNFIKDFVDVIDGEEEGEEDEECADEVVREDKKDDSKDEAFEAIMGSMGADVTQADIARLVFLWTKSEKFCDIERPLSKEINLMIGASHCRSPSREETCSLCDRMMSFRRSSQLPEFFSEAYRDKCALHAVEGRKMSLSSMPALQHRHNTVNILESPLGASLTGSANACLEIGHQIKYSSGFGKSAACIQSELNKVADEFYGIRSAFQETEQNWSHPTGQQLWTANTTNTVKHAQHVAQDVAKALRDIVRQCDTWDVVVPDHFYYQMQAFEICLQRQQLVLTLLGMVLYVVSPCELPTYPYYKVSKSLEEMEREKLKYGRDQLSYAVLMRQEMQAKLSKIASIDPEHKEIDVVEAWEIPYAEDWPSPQTTMGNTTPTEDSSCFLHRDDTASGPMDYAFLPSPGSHPTNPIKHRQSKDAGDRSLEEMLDNFGHENKLDGSWPIGGKEPKTRGLAMLAFHWTNAEVFADVERKDLEPLKMPTVVQQIRSCFKRDINAKHSTHSRRFVYINLSHSKIHEPIMPSELIKKYGQTIPICYDRLYNSVIGSAQACSRISDELLESGMQRQTACMQPAVGLLQSEFSAMHYALKDLQFVVGSLVWHDNATATVKCIWHVVTPDHLNDKLHALVITLQEQQMTLELLIVVMAFFDTSINAPPAVRQYRVQHHEPGRFDNLLDGILEGVAARRAMRQDVLELHSSNEQHEDKSSARSSEELPDADTWSSSRSTVTLGAMTPTGDCSDVNFDSATSEDRDLEDVLETINMERREEEVAKLVFHWTNVTEFGSLSRNDPNKESRS